MTIHADPWATPNDPSSIAEQVRPSAVLSTAAALAFARADNHDAGAAQDDPHRRRQHALSARDYAVMVLLADEATPDERNTRSTTSPTPKRSSPTPNPAPHSGAAHQHPAVPELGASTHHIDHPHERKTPTRTPHHRHACRTAHRPAAGTEPSPCLACRTRAVLAGATPGLVRIADGRTSHRSPALRTHRRAPPVRPTTPSRPTPSPPSAFLAGDFSAARSSPKSMPPN